MLGKLPTIAAAPAVLFASPLAAHDPLEAVIVTSDAELFATLYSESDGKPSLEQIETEHHSHGREGLALMQATRFRTVENLRNAIARSPATYRDAIQRCLPVARSSKPLDPATGDGIVILSTGNPMLATELAGEWVFWKTGKVDSLTFASRLPAALAVFSGGVLIIVIGAALGLWARTRDASRRLKER